MPQAAGWFGKRLGFVRVMRIAVTACALTFAMGIAFCAAE
jgi:hypothetical protein